jgi:hypothetical protein
MEAEQVSKIIKYDNVSAQEIIDTSYYDNLVNKAVETISEYGDFDLFVSDDAIPNPVANAN